jgi:hypothetical protein
MIILCFCDHTRQVLGIVTVIIFLASSGRLLKKLNTTNFDKSLQVRLMALDIMLILVM